MFQPTPPSEWQGRDAEQFHIHTPPDLGSVASTTSWANLASLSQLPWIGSGQLPDSGARLHERQVVTIRDGDTFELERMPININNPESLASLSEMSQISAPPTILGSTSSVLNPGYMSQRDREEFLQRRIEGEVFTHTVEAPANQTLQRLEQLNQTVAAALQAGRTAASPAVAAAAAERQQINFFP